MGKSKFEQLNNKEWIVEKYILGGFTQQKIADEIGCSQDSVKAALDRFGIVKDRSQVAKERHTQYPRQSKYPLLNDVEWLRNKVFNEKSTYQAIADIVGAPSPETITKCLKRLKIFNRRRLKPHICGKTFWDQLNDKEWLENKYLVELCSMNSIAGIVGNGCTACNVRAALKRKGIKIRSKKEGQRVYFGDQGIRLDDRIIGIINGGMLGDATLIKTSETSNASYSKRSIHKEYLIHELNLLYCGKVDPEKSIHITPPRDAVFRGKTYKAKESFSFRTYAYPEFSKMHDKWYVGEYNKKTKVIPRDIVLTKETLLYWFMDDGYSYFVERKYPTYTKKQLRVYLCTQGFVLGDLEFLSSKIKDQFGLVFKPRHHKRKTACGSGYELELSLKDVKKFFDIIGPCPVKCFDYKWKL